MYEYLHSFRDQALCSYLSTSGNDDGNTIIDVTHPKTPSCCFYAYASGKCMESLPLSAVDYVSHYYEVQGGLR